MESLKEKMLSLLEKGREFRLAVAGMLGLRDIMERLERHDRKFNEILEELRAGRQKLGEHDRKFNEILEELKVHRDKLEEHDRKFNEIIAELKKHRKILDEHSALLHRYITTMEEEAHEVISYRLRERGISVELSVLVLPDLEINVYGASDEVCVVGETAVRLGKRKVMELGEKVKVLKDKYPKLLRPKIIKVLYTMRATDEAISRARSEEIWVLTATKELAPLIV